MDDDDYVSRLDCSDSVDSLGCLDYLGLFGLFALFRKIWRGLGCFEIWGGFGTFRGIIMWIYNLIWQMIGKVWFWFMEGMFEFLVGHISKIPCGLE